MNNKLNVKVCSAFSRTYRTFSRLPSSHVVWCKLVTVLLVPVWLTFKAFQKQSTRKYAQLASNTRRRYYKRWLNEEENDKATPEQEIRTNLKLVQNSVSQQHCITWPISETPTTFYLFFTSGPSVHGYRLFLLLLYFLLGLDYAGNHLVCFYTGCILIPYTSPKMCTCTLPVEGGESGVAILVPIYRLGSGVNLPIGPLRRPVDLRECHQLQHVEGILPAFNILLHILNPTSLPPHAVQGSCEVILVELVLVSQQGTLLQGYRHRRPVFGTFTAGEPDPVQPSADRSSEPQYLHILPLLRHYILAQGSK